MEFEHKDFVDKIFDTNYSTQVLLNTCILNTIQIEHIFLYTIIEHKLFLKIEYKILSTKYFELMHI